jgi:hypothetical protein
LAILLSVLLRFTASDYPFGIFKLLAIMLSVLSRFTASDYPFCIFKLLANMLSVLLRFTASDYPFGIFKLFLFLSANQDLDSQHHMSWSALYSMV